MAPAPSPLSRNMYSSPGLACSFTQANPAASCPLLCCFSISHEKIKRNSQLFKAVCIPGYIGYVLVCVYGINGAKGFAAGFWQLLVILSVMNLIDRFLIDGYWVGHTNAWTIPGTEDLKPYITAKDKQKKWLFGTVGMAGIAAVLAVLMTAFIH